LAVETLSAAQKAATVCLRAANHSRRSTHFRVAAGSYVERVVVSGMVAPSENRNGYHPP